MLGLIGFGVVEVLALLFFVPLCLLGTIFWIWMLVDCATKENDQGSKIAWVLIILFTHFIGALVYFFVRRLRRV